MPRRRKILVLFGTRPEIIKLAPVIRELHKSSFMTTIVSSSQHRHLLEPFLKVFGVVPDHDLDLMRKDQTLNHICSEVIRSLDEIILTERPDVILVQGDTSTALAGAIAGFNCKIPVGHVEAGLRSGDRMSPYPEEMNRRIISQIADFHFAATEANRHRLLAEGITEKRIEVTGNTVVDTLTTYSAEVKPSKDLGEILGRARSMKLVLLTSHRRESFGSIMEQNLRVLSDFVRSRPDVCLLFPVHPNPNVGSAAGSIFADQERIYLVDPLDYNDFIAAMKAAWLVVSDSGGIQEEAPSLGKALLVLRENTERNEAIEAGVAKLVGGDPKKLKEMLESNYNDESWIESVRTIKNPFGDGTASKRIVAYLKKVL